MDTSSAADSTAFAHETSRFRVALAHSKLKEIYRHLVLSRLIEERMLLLLRQGQVSKWFAGIGQEAVSVGSTLALRPEEFILPLHRNLGVFTARGMDLIELFAQLQGKQSGFTKGRDRSFHFGSLRHHISGMISHLGPSMGVADGIALADKLSGSDRVTLVFCGDGGTSQGDFHEAINIAAVWDLPVIFLIENNGWGLSTPLDQQYRCSRLSDRAIAYGIQGYTIDGNNVLDVYGAVQTLAQRIRSTHQPVILECLTFRMRGHEEASGIKYVPPALIEQWAKRDPVAQFESFLLQERVLTEADVAETRAELNQEILNAVDVAFGEAEPVPDTATELAEVYAPFTAVDFDISALPKREMRFVDAVSDGLRESMRRYDRLIIMGQDVGEYGGVFKVTEGFVDEFGAERVRNTPLCESSIIGTGLGLGVNGYKSVVEMQFADFVSTGFTQVVNNVAKVHYRWGVRAETVIRMPTGAGVGAGPFHSQSNEAWFSHTPGLKIAYPAFPDDAKGLLIAAIEDPNPVMYFEHKALYRSVKGEVPDGYYTIPFGKARVVQEGEDLTIITYGMGVHWALDFIKARPELSIYLLDLRTLIPLDYAAMADAAAKTGRVLVLHEATLLGGIGGEIAAYLGEECFSSLDAPVMRCASLDTPVPFAIPLENNFLASARLEETVRRLLEY